MSASRDIMRAQISLPFQRGYDDPTALWCAPPSRSSGNELVYAGSDADVSILRLLQPWETHAHFIDTFAAPSEDMLPVRYFEDYIRRRADDTRASYRETTLPLRPVSNCTARRQLANLFMRRLREDSWLTNAAGATSQDGRLSAHWCGATLRFTFDYRGVRRFLRVTIADYDKALWLHPNAREHLPRITTIACPGSRLDWGPIVPKLREHNLRSVRILATGNTRGEQHILQSLAQANVRVLARTVGNRSRRTHGSPRLAGHRPISALCAAL